MGIVLGKNVAVPKNFRQVGRTSGNRGKRRFKLPEPLVMAEFMHINSRHLDPAVASPRHEYAFALKVCPKAFYLPSFSFSFARRTRHSFRRLHLSPRREAYTFTRNNRATGWRARDALRKLAAPDRIKLAFVWPRFLFLISSRKTERGTRASFYLPWYVMFASGRDARAAVHSLRMHFCASFSIHRLIIPGSRRCLFFGFRVSAYTDNSLLPACTRGSA